MASWHKLMESQDLQQGKLWAGEDGGRGGGGVAKSPLPSGLSGMLHIGETMCIGLFLLFSVWVLCIFWQINCTLLWRSCFCVTARGYCPEAPEGKLAGAKFAGPARNQRWCNSQTQLESGYMLPQKEVEEWACHLKGVYLEKWKKDLGRGILPKDPLQNLPSIPVQHINSTGPSLGLFTHCKIWRRRNSRPLTMHEGLKEEGVLVLFS